MIYSLVFIVLVMKADKLNNVSNGARHGFVEQFYELVSSSVRSKIVYLQEIDSSFKGQCKMPVDLMFRKQFCKVKVALPACYLQRTSDSQLLITVRFNSR